MEKDKIEIGEYIKLKRGDIFKIDEDTANYYNSNKEFITNEIVKHSKNIIDLIEVGDYVNGFKVSATNKKYIETDTNNCDCVEGMSWLIENTDIKSIVTKEQFKEMEYRV